MIVSAVSDNGIVQLITVTLIFAFVLAITIFTTRWLGTFQKKKMSGSNIKVLEGFRISNNKILEIVKAGDKCFLIAVCKDTVTTIGEIDESTLELKNDVSSGEAFSYVFNRFKITKGKSGLEDNLNDHDEQ